MELFLGQDEQHDIVRVELDDNRVIKSLSGYTLITPEQSYDNHWYLSNHSWGGDYEVNGITYKRGMKLAKDFTPYYMDDKTKEVIEGDDFYENEGLYCEECGTFHDSDQYSDISYIITEQSEVLCKTCAKADDLIVEVIDSADIFNSKDIIGMDAPDDFEELETLFCDSTGWGNDNEPALTREQACSATQDLLDIHGALYSAITGMGQFQVYVTLYKKA